MAVVNPKSISGINSITMASGSDDLLTIHSNNTTERVRINNSGDVIVGSGVTLSVDGHSFHTGVVTATSFSGDGSALTGIAATDNVRTGILDVAGVGTFRGDVNIPDKIIHLGDTNTAIRFPEADTITAETGGSERFRIASDGNIGINTDFTGSQTWRSGKRLEIFGGSGNVTGEIHLGAIRSDANESVGSVNFFDNGQDSTHKQIALIEADKAGSTSNKRGGSLLFFTKPDNVASPAERLRINNNGDLLYGSSDRNYASWYKSPTNSSSSAATSAEGILTFGTAVIANTDVYTTSNGRYTAPVDGLYHIRCNGLIDNNASDGGKQLLMYRNGSVYGSQIAYNSRNNSDFGDYHMLSGTGIMYMSAGDYASIHASAGMHVSNETSFIVYLIRGTV